MGRCLVAIVLLCAISRARSEEFPARSFAIDFGSEGLKLCLVDAGAIQGNTLDIVLNEVHHCTLSRPRSCADLFPRCLRFPLFSNRTVRVPPWLGLK